MLAALARKPAERELSHSASSRMDGISWSCPFWRIRIAASPPWSLRRILNFSDTGALRKRYLLLGAMIVSLISILIVLRLSFNLQQGFRMIRSGLRRLETDPDYRIPDQNRRALRLRSCDQQHGGKPAKARSRVAPRGPSRGPWAVSWQALLMRSGIR